MNTEEKANSLEPEDIPSGTGSKLEATKLPEGGPEDTNPAAPIAAETPQAVEVIEQPVDADGSPSSSVEPAPLTDEVVPLLTKWFHPLQWNLYSSRSTKASLKSRLSL